jgi:hypothetical protein
MQAIAVGNVCPENGVDDPTPKTTVTSFLDLAG